MEKYNLFLDDFRNPEDCANYMSTPHIYRLLKWDVVRSYDEFKDVIEQRGLPEIISFDHDLADEHYDSDMYSGDDSYNKKYEHFTEKTGYDCAKWLVEYCMDRDLDLPQYVVHSMNPAGGRNIWEYLESYTKFRDRDKSEKEI